MHRPAALLCCSLAVLPGTILRAQTARVRDSAGVAIVENGVRAKAPVVFKLGPVRLDLGGIRNNLDEELVKSPVLSAVSLSDGRTIVTASDHLQLFDPRGSLIKTIGRKGEGPGEYRYAGSACRSRGDTTVVRDANNARMSILDGSGTLVRSFTYTEGLLPDACFSDGTVLQMAGGTHRIGPDSLLTHLIAVNSKGVQVHDFGEQPHLNLLIRTASWFAGDYLYIGDAKTSEVRLFGMNGKLARIVRTADRPEEAMTDGKATGGIRDASSGAVRTPPKPSGWNYPAYGKVFVDPQGRIWMEDDGHVAVRYWTAFDAKGQMLGRLPAPKYASDEFPRVLGFGTNEIVVTYRDDDGARHITFYSLLPVSVAGSSPRQLEVYRR